MKGFITRAALLCSAVLGTVGCYGYRDLVDPCYPERYWYSSRQLEKAALAPQVQNGHVLDQTVWNYHFDVGTAQLNGMGMDHLARLARRRPNPDPLIFLQTAQDISYDSTAPKKMVEQRSTIDADRIKAVYAFLEAQTAGRPVAFQVQVHDPAEVGLPTTPVNNAVQGNWSRFTGKPGTGGTSTAGGSATGSSSGGR